MKTKLLLILVALFSSATFAKDFSAVEEKLKTAMQADFRTDKEKARDRNRKPVQTLKFLGLRDDMQVAELLPGGGWYTKLLLPTLKDNGKLYVAYGTGRAVKAYNGHPDANKLFVTAKDAKIYRKDGERFLSLEKSSLQVNKLDMVLTFRNYHNFSEEGRKEMNKAAYKALKKGGIYGVVDHTRRHMQSNNDENRRRVDPVLAIKEIQEAGFELVDYSTLHYRADDELRYEVGRKSVSGNTDRWTLKFIKK